MNILHIRNIANVGATLAAGQRAIGHKSICVQIISKSSEFKADVNLNLPPKYKAWELPSRLRTIKSGIAPYADCDILHLHDGGLYPRGIDVLSRKRKGPVVVHWHGSKLRDKGQGVSKYASKTFVSTPDLLRHAPGSTWIPNPIMLESLPPSRSQENNSRGVTIFHAPSDRQMKGTVHIERAVKKLEKKGYKIDFQIVERKPHEEIIRTMLKADIVIDQISSNIGSYGMVSIEGMALGKPVICSVNDEYLDKHFQGCPIFRTKAEQLISQLSLLVEDSALRNSAGQAGRRYVEEKHELSKVVHIIDKHYSELI